MRNPLRFLTAAAPQSTIRERLAAGRAKLVGLTLSSDPQAETGASRRAVMGGALAAAVPLPALAGASASGSHPDRALLDAGAAFLAARAQADAADVAYRPAREALHTALAHRPVDLLPTEGEHRMCSPPWGYSCWGNVRFRWVPPIDEEVAANVWTTVAWTGPALRHVLARAVAVYGRGGRTPFLIRRWKALLPIADAFDAEVAAAEAAVDYHRLKRERDEALAEVDRQRALIAASVATTPEGLAALVWVVGEYGWKDTGGAWPNLLRSAANVAGVDPASLEHPYASRRPYSRA